MLYMKLIQFYKATISQKDVVHARTHPHTEEYYRAVKKVKSCHLQQHGWTLGYYAK